jgi:DNA-directed RNA polymerase subunit L
MDTRSVKVEDVEVTRLEIDYKHPTAGSDIQEAFAEILGSKGLKKGSDFRLPLAKEKVSFVLAGVPAAVPNAIRRAVRDEIRGRCLSFELDDYVREKTSDPFMLYEFVRERIRLIPLRPQVSESVVKTLRLGLYAKNHTGNVMTVYSGDLQITQGALSAPLFNPTHEIAFLQPGRTLCIKNIRLVEGQGSEEDDAAFLVGARSTSIPLDLKRYPRKETHMPGGSKVAQSGFVQSSLVSNPRRFRVSVYFPAVPKGGRASLTVLVDTCGTIMARLRFVQKVLRETLSRLSAGGSAPRGASASFLISAEKGRTMGTLSVRGETDTIGNLITRAIYELTPDISYVSYDIRAKVMVLSVAQPVSEPNEIVTIVERAVKHCYAIFDTIQKSLKLNLS